MKPWTVIIKWAEARAPRQPSEPWLQAPAWHSHNGIGFPLRVKRARGGARHDRENVCIGPRGKTAAAADRAHADGVRHAAHDDAADIISHHIMAPRTLITVMLVRGGKSYGGPVGHGAGGGFLGTGGGQVTVEVAARGAAAPI